MTYISIAVFALIFPAVLSKSRYFLDSKITKYTVGPIFQRPLKLCIISPAKGSLKLTSLENFSYATSFGKTISNACHFKGTSPSSKLDLSFSFPPRARLSVILLGTQLPSPALCLIHFHLSTLLALYHHAPKFTSGRTKRMVFMNRWSFQGKVVTFQYR